MNARITQVFRCTNCCAASGEQHDRGCPQRESSAAEVINIARAREEWAAYYTRTAGTPPQPMDEARLFPTWLEATRLALADHAPVAKAYHRPFGSVAELLPEIAGLPHGEYLLYTRPWAPQGRDST